MCSSIENKESNIFPIYKERVEGSKHVKNICMITTPENSKNVPFDKKDD